MNIGVIGTGNIGEVIIRKLREAGYPVKMANARGPESLRDLGAKTGAIPVSVSECCEKPFQTSELLWRGCRHYRETAREGGT